jgi:hypothetical protein
LRGLGLRAWEKFLSPSLALTRRCLRVSPFHSWRHRGQGNPSTWRWCWCWCCLPSWRWWLVCSTILSQVVWWWADAALRPSRRVMGVMATISFRRFAVTLLHHSRVVSIFFLVGYASAVGPTVSCTPWTHLWWTLLHL